MWNPSSHIPLDNPLQKGNRRNENNWVRENCLRERKTRWNKCRKTEVGRVESVKGKPRTNSGITPIKQCRLANGILERALQSSHSAWTCKDECELRQDRKRALDTLLAVCLPAGTLYLLSSAWNALPLLLKWPSPHLADLNHVIFFFTALVIWNYQVPLLMDFSLFASQCTISIADDWMSDEQITRPPVKIDKALESQVTHELLGLIERDLLSWAASTSSFWVPSELGSHPSQHSDHWEGAL